MSSKFRRNNKQTIKKHEYKNIIHNINDTIIETDLQASEIKENEQDIIEIKEQLNVYVDSKITDLTNRIVFLENVIQNLLNLKL